MKELGLLLADLKLIHGWRFGYQVFPDVYFRPKQEDVVLEVAQRSVIICNTDKSPKFVQLPEPKQKMCINPISTAFCRTVLAMLTPPGVIFHI